MRGNKLVLMAIVGLMVLCLLALDATAKKGGGGKPPPTVPDPAIAYAASGRLMVMNADGTNVTEVFDGNGADIGRPDWSPDGTQLLFASNLQGNGIFVINLDGTGLRKVITPTVYHFATAPRWSPDPVPGVGGNQTRIAYMDETTPGWNDIYIVNVDGTGRVQVTNTPSLHEAHPTWSPSATKLAVRVTGSGVQGQGDFYAIYDFTTDTYDVRQHQGPLQGGSSFQPSWAKTDESLIAFAAGAAGDRWDVWVVDLDDPANPLRLTNDPDQTVRAPSWSPDDSQLAFLSAQARGGRLNKHAIEVMSSVDGSQRTKIRSVNAGPSWRR